MNDEGIDNWSLLVRSQIHMRKKDTWVVFLQVSIWGMCFE